MIFLLTHIVTIFTYVLGILGKITGNRNAVQVTEEGYRS